ncbi:hypothetical protein [Halopseudomonas pelagia]|uniref:Uncharacterized protein n=1 Tax=Halopseudomonas pelagia TaxID=553151 RepID=A0AA91U2T9_9GAMM|nr:hypothetical protein [Halopseudomonas pelagia]PCC99699.1 hypothetical protein CO192_09175 [Halopseudomonas pelagia]QFY55910.1 hypothetical protein EAO82_05780 [Halopseudomonas pelagia]
MPLFKSIKNQFLVKHTPKASEIVVSKKAHKIANILLTVGILVLPLSFAVVVYKILFFNGLKLDVGEFVFSLLMLGVVIAFISAIKTLVGLINAHSNYLRGVKERRLKVACATMASYTFTIYMAFFSVNEVYLLGKYNDGAHEGVCTVYVPNGAKTDICIDYEESKENETSLMSRALYFLN